MLDDGVKGAGIEDDQIKVADLSIHLLDAIEAGERTRPNEDEAPLRADLQSPLTVSDSTSGI
jgi:hypothetical protein